MKFGIDVRNRISGSDIAVFIFQAVSILPAIYVFTASGYIALLSKRNILTVLFDFGICALPRWESYLLSLGYRLSSSELVPYFASLFIALFLGIAVKRYSRGYIKLSLVSHCVFSALIIADLVVRLLPLSINGAFTLPVSAAAFAVRVICLVLIILDIVFYKRNSHIGINTNINK